MRSFRWLPGVLLFLCVRCNTSSGGAASSVDSGPAGPAECCVGGGQFALCNVCPNVDCGQQQGTVCPVYTYGCEGGVPWTSLPDYSPCPPDAGAATDAGSFDSAGGG